MNAALRPVARDVKTAPDVLESPPSPEPVAVKRPSRFRFLCRRPVISAALALLAAAAGTLWILAPARSESTDDAYVGVDATSVAPKVRGLVADVLVRDNEVVHAGEPLVRIDPEEFDAKVATAAAELEDAQAGVRSARAALDSLTTEERLARANVAAARTAIRSAQAEAERADVDTHRYDALVESGAVARRDADSVRAGAITAAQNAARAIALLSVAEAASQVTTARRPGLQASLERARAAVERAGSALALARQDQRHALILAPVDGVIGNRQVQPGDYVQAGTRLLTLVPLRAVYVTAHFKETQTTRMVPGERATIQVDALPGRSLTGVVDSLAPGSGSEFALLPFEPGTGNFTKIVQRVPVRIRFDTGQADLGTLRPGLSATVRVTLRR